MKAQKIHEEIQIINLFLKNDKRMTKKYRNALEVRIQNLKASIGFTLLGPIIATNKKRIESLRQEILG